MQHNQIAASDFPQKLSTSSEDIDYGSVTQFQTKMAVTYIVVETRNPIKDISNFVLFIGLYLNIHTHSHYSS